MTNIYVTLYSFRNTIREARSPTTRALVKLAAALLIAAVTLPAAISVAAAPAGTVPYPRMASVDAYLMDRAQEIALARSAAPGVLSGQATILVLNRNGYETAVPGTNGFLCMVSRGFSSAPDWPERWNPKIRAAECLNPQAARSVAPIARMRTAMTLAGWTDAEIAAGIASALRSGSIPPVEPGSMSYMMSARSYLQDAGDHDMAHVMFFVPLKDGASLGANTTNSPLVGGNYWFVAGSAKADAAGLPPLSVLLIGSATWSDGTPAPMHVM